jgi:hypothetical protein
MMMQHDRVVVTVEPDPTAVREPVPLDLQLAMIRTALRLPLDATFDEVLKRCGNLTYAR